MGENKYNEGRMLEIVVDMAYLTDEAPTQVRPINSTRTMDPELPDLLIFVFKQNQELRFLYKIS